MPGKEGIAAPHEKGGNQGDIKENNGDDNRINSDSHSWLFHPLSALAQDLLQLVHRIRGKVVVINHG